jgi:hypothetical protein
LAGALACTNPTGALLHRQWANRTVHGEVAVAMAASQRTHCASAQGAYPMEQFGMGSNLHRWSLALCYAMTHKTALVSIGKWVWEDEEVCSESERDRPLTCYFGDLNCVRDLPAAAASGWAWDPRVLRAHLGCKVIYLSDESVIVRTCMHACVRVLRLCI